MDKEDIVCNIMEYYSAIKKNEIMPFAATWMDFEGNVLSELSQRKKNTMWYPIYVESKNYNKLVNKTNKQKKQKADSQI